MKTIQELFELQLDNYLNVRKATCEERIDKLTKLEKSIHHYRKQIKQAIYEDFKKPFAETDLTEIYPVLSEIRFAKKLLRLWMEKQRVKTPLSLFGASSWIRRESKGVCLIISPWNFPFNLTFGPLVSALAAGNTAIVKPSEKTPVISALMQEILRSTFEENEVAVVQGGVEVSTELLALPFHHIHFVGSPKVGKIVMKAAAEHLASLTLELGGKSPTIVDESADLKKAAKRIAWAKFLNAGQICIAPDYLFVQQSVKDAFLEELTKQIDLIYSNSKGEFQACLVDEFHFQRLMSFKDEALQKGADLIYSKPIGVKNAMPPTLLEHVSEDSKIMCEEIFGPLLPVKTFVSIAEVINYINAKDRPLALYVFSRKRKNIRQILDLTTSGTTVINSAIIQYNNPHLPFGGINNSGMGRAHGKYGFDSFSNMRSVVRQYGISPLDFIIPPYNRVKERMIEFTLRYL